MSFSIQNITNANIPATLTIENRHSEKLTFADTTKQNKTDNFPNKNQAIVLNAVEELKIKDYIMAIGNIIEPKNILFASRISNNRICMYLKNKEIVDKLISNNENVEIENCKINIRRLISPAKRIILSNVCPSIPHIIIEDELKRNGQKLISPLSFLRAGLQESEYSHILSFRRQVYVSPENNVPLPESLVINHEETSYRIFLTEDGITCFLCKQVGHTTNQCKNNNTNTPTITTTTTNLMQTVFKRPPPESTISETSNQDENRKLFKESKTTPNSSDVSTIPKTTEKPAKRIKKSKVDNQSTNTSMEELLKPAKNFIYDNPTFILTYEELTDFLENTLGGSDHLKMSQEYTYDTEKLLDMLTQVYPRLEHRSIKNRITRIKSQIRKQQIFASQQPLSDHPKQFSQYISPNPHSSHESLSDF